MTEAPWYSSRYTGIFTALGAVAPRPHDPRVSTFAGTVVSASARPGGDASGAGWDDRSAELACVGEAIERLAAFPVETDGHVVASFACWDRDEPAVAPGRFVLFHEEQYRQPGFPFAPFRDDVECRWVAFRDAVTGHGVWVPEELGHLAGRPGEPHRIAPSVSTGLSCGRSGSPVLLRGLQETIERDGVLGAWWGSYPLEAHDPRRVLARLGGDVPERVERPNLRHAFFRVATPFSAHVTLATLEAEDREGFLFAVGSACRETRAASYEKSLLEAVQGLHYVRNLRRLAAGEDPGSRPADFPAHALHYSLHPDELARTPLRRAAPADDGEESLVERAPALVERLGPSRPVLFRSMTPPWIASAHPEWCVLRVIVPGLQPLHGDDALAHLGGPLWAPRGLAELRETPTHPFP